MSKTNLWKKSNVHDSHELQKSWNNPTFSDSDDDGEGFSIVVNSIHVKKYMKTAEWESGGVFFKTHVRRFCVHVARLLLLCLCDPVVATVLMRPGCCYCAYATRLLLQCLCDPVVATVLMRPGCCYCVSATRLLRLFWCYMFNRKGRNPISSLYSFIESKATYINLILRLKCEDEKENSAPKGKYLKVNKKSLQEEKEDREDALNLIREIVRSKFPKRSDEQIDLYLKELASNSPQYICAPVWLHTYGHDSSGYIHMNVYITFLLQHVLASTRSCFNTFLLQHVLASTRSCFNTFVLQHVLASTRSCFNTFVLQHVRASTRSCFNTFLLQHVHTSVLPYFPTSENPPPENCSLHDTLFQRNEKNIFVKHNLISYILNFVDCKTLIKFKECSKIDNEMVSLYLRKILYTLSFKDNEIKTNIHYWRNVVDYFFFKSGNLKPIERSKYPMIVNELEKNKSFCTITKDSMDSNIFISLDYFNENLISSCNHNNPLPHTCNSKNKINGITHFKCDKITIVDFIEEYYKRLTINDDELMWNVCNFRKSPEFLTLLLFEYLKCMLSVLNKYSGICLFKKTEYMVNCGHHISHRIWIQMFYEYGHDSANMDKKKKNKQNVHNTDNVGDHENDDNNNRTLYLTIADHYKWDA
ncbi:conserved Plasmodium protein, unknown function [Plasmodium ovale wallikeri]|uniref:Uncharacterized protein n=1 Tax=Plasmodium ovale wallikeri TaxID=864142 RepID=A0A1A8YN83_PLAOA|nr:conserved Plasmodium protein, unknown function [Plasmodium ovale wallikeri]SBT50201.1 conserved Plasmodium protein, unknown function [Plasmodium ovale wallikeri]